MDYAQIYVDAIERREGRARRDATRRNRIVSVCARARKRRTFARVNAGGLERDLRETKRPDNAARGASPELIRGH